MALGRQAGFAACMCHGQQLIYEWHFGGQIRIGMLTV